MSIVAFTSLDNGDYGRLGNQLFEIAATYGIAKKSNRIPLIPENWRYKNEFNIANYMFHSFIGLQLVDYVYSGYLYEEPPLGNINLKGWFQSAKYFHEYRDEIKELFYPKEKRYQINKCAIHVRRTDYLDEAWAYRWNVPNVEYYTNLIEKYNERSVLVFSDDISWCKNTFGTDSIYEYSEKDEVGDLIDMASCHRIICASSSYSWWAGYLADHNNVHLPEIWLDGIKYKDTELIIPEWQHVN